MKDFKKFLEEAAAAVNTIKKFKRPGKNRPDIPPPYDDPLM